MLTIEQIRSLARNAEALFNVNYELYRNKLEISEVERIIINIDKERNEHPKWGQDIPSYHRIYFNKGLLPLRSLAHNMEEEKATNELLSLKCFRNSIIEKRKLLIADFCRLSTDMSLSKEQANAFFNDALVKINNTTSFYNAYIAAASVMLQTPVSQPAKASGYSSSLFPNYEAAFPTLSEAAASPMKHR